MYHLFTRITILNLKLKQESNLQNSDFKAGRVTQTATIKLNDKIENIFSLFGAFEERKWAEGWNPVLIYPQNEIIEEGTIFTTEGDGEELEYLWRVSKYSPKKYSIQYLVSTENRCWTITLQCRPLLENKTSTEITYTFTGLNEKGNKINEQSLQRMYKNNLKDWEDEINVYLEKTSKNKK